MDTKKFEQAFLELVEEDTAGAMQLITGMFVGLTLEYLRRNGEDVDKAILIKGGDSRDITIHAPNAQS